MRIVVTICSRRKNESPELIPAKERYLGEHIREVERIAHDLTAPFFILSGKFGLLESCEEIPNYDYLLENPSTELIRKVSAQLKEHNVTEIDFYTKGKGAWMPYQEVLEQTSKLAGIPLDTHQLT